MKTLFKAVIRVAKKTLAAASLGIALGLSIASCETASAQNSIALTSYPLTNGTAFKLTNGAMGIVTVTSSNINSQPFQIWRGRGFSFNAGFWSTNASTANVNMTLRFAARHTVNGVVYTNWITTGQAAPISFNAALNGTTEVFFQTNVPPTAIDNVDLGQFTTATNAHTATLFFDPTNTFVSVFP
jgi:hypothetical protein